MTQVTWLPPLIQVGEYDDETAYLDALYKIFRQDFMDNSPTFRGASFRLKRYPKRENREATFWHVTTQGQEENNRTLDLDRCARLSWIRLIIEAADSDNVKTWRNKRGNESNILMALPDFSYVVVVRDRGFYLLLWTAYCVKFRNQRRKLEREYKSYKVRK